MIKRDLRLPIAAMVMSLAACTPPQPKAPPAQLRDPADTCVADPGQVLIGHRADALSGAELMRATNSREVRWVGPGVAVTMEYKFGRLTVGYDAAMNIVSVVCG